MRVKSSSVISTFDALAIAKICNTALVDPPSAMTTVIAFSNASFVIISLGRMPFSSKLSTAAPARSQSRFLSSDTAACAELLGKLIPSASIADAIVFAVYIPPHDPAPGIAFASISASSASSILLFARAPTASNTETTSNFFSL